MSTSMTAALTQGDLIKREFDRDYSREVITLKAGDAYPLGAVLGRVTATGLYALSPAASTAGLEGAEIACAVLVDPVPASTVDRTALVLARGPVILADSALQFDASVTDASTQSLKHQQLAAHGIVVRSAV